MSETTRDGLGILGAAAGLGALGGWLWRSDGPIGLNAFLWFGMLVAVLLLIVRQRRMLLTAEARWLLAPAVLAAAGLLWRDSELLQLLDVMTVVVCLGLAARHARAEGLRRSGLVDYATGLFLAGSRVAGGAVPLVTREINWQEAPRGRWSERTSAVGRGLLIAVPLLLVFGGLFVSADAAFERLVSGLLQWNLSGPISWTLTALFWAWVSAGFLRAATALPESWVRGALGIGALFRGLTAAGSGPAAGAAPAAGSAARAGGGLGAVETGIALGLLNLLFMAFVLVQFRYLFGGAAVVAQAAGPTYAEYARRGFFELVTAATLVLPLLLTWHWLLPRSGAGSAPAYRLFRLLSLLLIALLCLVMASAVHRMWLYLNQFGLTEQRLYATAFMAWLAVLFAWFAATVLRDRRERFAFGALVTGLLLVAALHAANPDALIARTNLARWEAGLPFDPAYAGSLSADAVPTLAAGLERAPEGPERQVLGERLRTRWSPPASPDWRSWNWARSRAWEAVAR